MKKIYLFFVAMIFVTTKSFAAFEGGFEWDNPEHWFWALLFLAVLFIFFLLKIINRGEKPEKEKRYVPKYEVQNYAEEADEKFIGIIIFGIFCVVSEGVNFLFIKPFQWLMKDVASNKNFWKYFFFVGIMYYFLMGSIFTFINFDRGEKFIRDLFPLFPIVLAGFCIIMHCLKYYVKIKAKN